MNLAQPRFLYPAEVTRPQEVPHPKGPIVVQRRRRQPFRWIVELLKQLRQAWQEDCLRQVEIEKHMQEAESKRGRVYSLMDRRNLF